MSETTKIVIAGIVGLVAGVGAVLGYAKYAYNKQNKGGNND